MLKNLAKVSIIGAGNVGSTTAMMLAQAGLANIILIDAAENIAKAKALDISQALAAQASNVTVAAAPDFKDTEGSDVVIVTAGFARKPGMTRDDLLKANAEIVKGVAAQLKKNAPSAIVIVVTNPLDVMTYLTYKITGASRAKVFGMAGVLDSARMAYFISEKLNVKRSDIKAAVLGSHGDLMVPVFSQTRLSGRPLSEFFNEGQRNELAQATRAAGAEIVSLLGTGSAYYGPAASITEMVKAILTNGKTTHYVCAYLQGEYGLRDVCIGVPCVLGEKGIERIIELKLAPDELAQFNKAQEAIKGMQRSVE